MGSENEPAKLLLPYLQRADELQKHELLVAYYCRLYAMERGLKFPNKDRTKTTNSILISLMNQLEKDKKSLKLGPDDSLYVEGFASNVFAKADKQDRAGRADLNTAKTFYAASIFFEILTQFGDVQPELEQKQKYAAWKAADIRKALKEGRKPVPGPPGGEKDDDFSDPSSSMNSYDLDPSFSTSQHRTGPPDAPPPASQFHDESSYNQSSSPPSSQFQEHDNNNYHHQSSSSSMPPPPYYASAPSSTSSQFHDKDNNNYQSYPSSSLPPSSPSYPTSDYRHNTDNEFTTHPPPVDRQDSFSSSYQQPYHQQTFPSEPPQPQNYPSQEFPPHPSSLPNFQSYPSFNDHTLPVAPSHPPYYQGSETSSYSQPQYAPPPPPAQAPLPPAQTFQYDINYQPSPEKIAEAHKAARFAVGSLAFDDVPTAVDFLKKSLELLTNPSSTQ
ncbi:hypothetical protein ACHQM5_025608 [Ranunculus cassubicifolius]